MSSLEQATLFSKHKKRQILKERGVDVERIQKERSYFQLASRISEGPLDNLDPNFFEENKAFHFNHGEMEKKFENASEIDLLDYIVAETIHDNDSLNNMAGMDNAIKANEKELDSISYEELLSKIQEIKTNIPKKQNVSSIMKSDSEYNEQHYSNWDSVGFEENFIRSILGDKMDLKK
jgi:hypothetical protein